MAMPSSGCLHLCNTAVTGTCRSIAHAVYGASPPATVSLLSAGTTAGFNTPINMTCFYGFSGIVSFNISFSISVDTVDYFDGTIYLRRTSDSQIFGQWDVSLPSLAYNGDIDVPSGNGYYFDFSLLVAYRRDFAVSRIISWSWFSAGTSGSSDLTSSVTSADSLSATIRRAR